MCIHAIKYPVEVYIQKNIISLDLVHHANLYNSISPNTHPWISHTNHRTIRFLWLVTTSTSAKHTKRQEPHPLDTAQLTVAMEGGDLTPAGHRADRSGEGCGICWWFRNPAPGHPGDAQKPGKKTWTNYLPTSTGARRISYINNIWACFEESSKKRWESDAWANSSW